MLAWTHRLLTYSPLSAFRLHFSAQLRNMLALLTTFPDGISLPPKSVFFSVSHFIFLFVFIKVVKSSLKSLQFRFFFCCWEFFFHYQMILLPHCLMYSILSNSAAQKKDVPLCTLERYNSMRSIAVVSTTSAEVSPDPNEQDAYVCTSFFRSFLKQAQIIVSSYYLN